MISAGEFIKWCAVFGIKIGGGGGGGVTAAQVQKSQFNTAVDTGVSGSAYVGALSPAPASLTDNLIVWFKPGTANNSPVTLALNGFPAKPIVDINALPIAVSAMFNNVDAQLVYNSTIDSFVLQNPLVTNTALATGKVFIGNGSNLAAPQALSGGVTVNTSGVMTVTSVGYAVDTGALNAVHLALTTGPSSYTGMTVTFECKHTNTSVVTISVNLLGSVPLRLNGNVALSAGAIVNGNSYIASYNSDDNAFILINPSTSSGITAQQIQNQSFTSQHNDTGTADNYVIALSPALTAYANFQEVWFYPGNTSLTTTPQININGLGNLPMFTYSGQALQVGDISSGIPTHFIIDADNSAVYVQNPYTESFLTISTVQNNAAFFFDSGSTNALVLSMGNGLPPLAAYQGGQVMWFRASNSNTGATTADVDGLGAISVENPDFSSLSAGAIIGGFAYFLFYTAGRVLLMNSSLPLNVVAPIQIQNQSFTYGVDGGSTNSYQPIITPILTAVPDGTKVGFFAANTNTGASMIDVGPGYVPLYYNDGGVSTPLLPNAIIANTYVEVEFSSGFAYLVNPSISLAAVYDGQYNTYTSAIDSGAVNAYALTLPIFNAGRGVTDGFEVQLLSILNTNTSSATLNVNAFGAFNILTPNFSLLTGGELLANANGSLIWNATHSAWILQNSALAPAGGGIVSQVIPVGSTIPLTSATPTDIASITVPAGTWTLIGNIYNLISTGASILSGWINDTSATAPDASLVFQDESSILGSSGFAVPGYTVSVASPTVFYLTADVTFATGTVSACGGIYAVQANAATSPGPFLPLAGGTMAGDITFGSTEYLNNLSGIRSLATELLLNFNYVSSAVNYFDVYNNVTGEGPALQASGSDSSIGIQLQPKNGYVGIIDYTGTQSGALALSNQTDTFRSIITVPLDQAQDITFVLPGTLEADNAMVLSDSAGNLSLSTIPYPAAPGWTTFTPTVTLIGGTGNVVPDFTNNTGRYSQVGNVVFVDFLLNNSTGGTPGAGSGQVAIDLPITAGATQSGANAICGYLKNGAASYPLSIEVLNGASVCEIGFQSGTTSQGADGATLNDANIRQMTGKFFYEV